MSAPTLMRVECPECERLAPPASFRLEGARLYLTCGRCGAEHLALESAARESRAQQGGASVPAAAVALASAASPSSPPGPARVSTVAPAAPALRVVAGQGATSAADEAALFSVPDGHCPKCVAPSKPEALACAACGLVFSNFVPGQQAPLPPAIVVGWRLLQERWEERAAHDALLAQAQAGGHLASVGRLYRIRLARQPQDAHARRALEEVVRLALLPSERAEERSEATPGMARATKWVVVLLFLLLLLGLGALLLRAAAPPVP